MSEQEPSAIVAKDPKRIPQLLVQLNENIQHTTELLRLDMILSPLETSIRTSPDDKKSVQSSMSNQLEGMVNQVHEQQYLLDRLLEGLEV